MFNAYWTNLAVCNQSHLVAEICNLPSDNYLKTPFMLQYPSIHLCLSLLKGAFLSLWLWQGPSSLSVDSKLPPGTVIFTFLLHADTYLPWPLECRNFGLYCFISEWWIDKSTFWFLRFRIFWGFRWWTSDLC